MILSKTTLSMTTRSIMGLFVTLSRRTKCHIFILMLNDLILSVAYFIPMPSVIMANVVVLSVVAPLLLFKLSLLIY
jgi:hypothetical protein